MKAQSVIIGIIVMAWLTPVGVCQSWIGQQFTLDTAVAATYSKLPYDMNHLQCGIRDSIFYFTDRKAFQEAENDFAAHMYAFSLNDYHTFEFDLPLPKTTMKTERFASNCWINDFDIHDNRCVISVQNQIFLYRKTTEKTFEFDTMLEHPNVKAVYMHQNQLYYLEEDHDTGYRWFRFDRSLGQEIFVRELAYEAPHVVQASPNRYLFHNENNLFFLSTRFPVLHKYGLDGTWIEDIRFDLPFWHPFEEDYIQKSLSIPYGIERIYATKDHIFNYSYPKMVFPLHNRYLLFYTQYDTCTRKSAPMFAIADSAGHSTIYNRHCSSALSFSDDYFPFNLLQPLEDLARTSWNGHLIELSADCESPWHNMTYEEYQKNKDQYFRHHDPVFKIRIMSLSEDNLTQLPFFYNEQQELTSLENLPKGKYIFLLHNELDCSSCSHYLLQTMNALDSTDIRAGIMYPFIPGALQERELNREIRQHLNRPYSLFFLATDRAAGYPRKITKKVHHFPAVLFYATGRAPILFSNDQIFENDLYSYRFSDSFLRTLEDFSAK